MSRLWPHQLYLNVEPHRIELKLFSGWPRAKLMKHEVFNVAEHGSDLLPLEMIDQLLKMHDQSTDCHIVLSNHYVRHLILPAYDASISDQELAALARHSFAEVYGERSEDWTIMTDYPYQLACAIESDWLASLQAVFKTHNTKTYNHKLRSVNSMLVTHFNQHHQNIQHGVQALIQMEKKLLMVALFQNGLWLRLTAMQFNAERSLELKPMIERELLLSGLDAPLESFILTHQSDIPPPNLVLNNAVEIKSSVKPKRGLSAIAKNRPVSSPSPSPLAHPAASSVSP